MEMVKKMRIWGGGGVCAGGFCLNPATGFDLALGFWLWAGVTAIPGVMGIGIYTMNSPRPPPTPGQAPSGVGWGALRGPDDRSVLPGRGW